MGWENVPYKYKVVKLVGIHGEILWNVRYKMLQWFYFLEMKEYATTKDTLSSSSSAFLKFRYLI